MSALPNPVARKPHRPLKGLSQPQQSPQKPASVQKRPLIGTEVSQHSAKFWESGLILGMNTVLIGTALVTFAHLLPYQMTQREKLKEISREESQVAQNIQELQQAYKRSQTPETAQRIAEEQGNLMRANQLKVFQIPQGAQ